MTTERLDNFTDAAFAFAISLLVIGGAGAPANFESLQAALGDVPAYAFGFAVIAMFWSGHVRWRALRGPGDGLSVALTLLIIFLTLIYVQPLRAMAIATGQYFTGQGQMFGGSLSGLFAVYGTGFVPMSFAMAALWAEALRKLGFGVAHVVPARGIFRGQSALVSLGRGGFNTTVLRDSVAQPLAFERGGSGSGYPVSLMGATALLRQTLLDANWYADAHARYRERGGTGLARPEANDALAVERLLVIPVWQAPPSGQRLVVGMEEPDFEVAALLIDRQFFVDVVVAGRTGPNLDD